MPTGKNNFNRYMLIVKKSGCTNYKKTSRWFGKCMRDYSCRKYGCWKECNNCKPLLKDRIKTAWHILTWDRWYIKQ